MTTSSSRYGRIRTLSARGKEAMRTIHDTSDYYNKDLDFLERHFTPEAPKRKEPEDRSYLRKDPYFFLWDKPWADQTHEERVATNCKFWRHYEPMRQTTVFENGHTVSLPTTASRLYFKDYDAWRNGEC